MRDQEPDVAVIHIGTNNLHNDAANGVANAVTQLRAMIETLRAADDDITILVAQVIPYLNTEGGDGRGQRCGLQRPDRFADRAAVHRQVQGCRGGPARRLRHHHVA